MKTRWMMMGLFGLVMFLVPALAMAQSDTEGAQPDEGDTHAAATHEEQPKFLLLTSNGAAFLGAALGAGLVIMGGAAGIGRIGGSAVESMARQPEASGSINGVALILAAMIEGATLFAVVVCLLGVLK